MGFALDLVEVDELVEVCLYLALVHVPLPEDSLCCFIELLLRELGVGLSTVGTNFLHACLLAALQLDKLVGHNTKLGEGMSLKAGSWEAFDDPRLVCLLSLLDLFADKFDQDLIVDVSELLIALEDLLAGSGVFLTFSLEGLSD